MAEIQSSYESLPTAERALRLTEIHSLLRDAAYGRLSADDDELEKVARDPDLWELKWHFGVPEDTEWRMYHAEPALAPGHLVALRFHQKCIEGTDAEIKAAQNAEIDLAVQRYSRGRATMWTIP